MKLLICSTSSTKCGGVENIIAALCRGLPSRGWEVSLALTQGAKFHDPALFEEVFPDIQTVAIDGSKGTRRARLKALRQVLEREAPDIVLNFRVFDLYEAMVDYKKSNPHCRYVVSPQNYEPPLLYDVRLYEAFVDGWVASGELITRCCQLWAGVSCERIANIPGGIHAALDNSQIRTYLDKPIKLLYAGRIVQFQKRIFDVVELLKELDRRGLDYSLTIAGSGPDEVEFEKAMEPWIQSRKVNYLGLHSHATLYEKVYPQADIFVHFADAEGVTIAPREAMAHGCVPVISNFQGIRTENHYQHEENSLIYPVGDMKTAADSIERLIEQPELYQKLSEQSVKAQSGKYSHEGAIDAWSQFMKRVIQMSVKSGIERPFVENRESGRLNKWIPHAGFRAWLRDSFGSPVDYQDPGSEWPTFSGMLDDTSLKELEAFASENVQ